MPKLDFERIVILESLFPNDYLKTGEELANYLGPMIIDRKTQPLVEFARFSSHHELKLIIENLTYEVINGGKIPVLHIETHGSEFGNGLVLGDNTKITWPEPIDLCVALNRATRFNLILVIAACYSGDLWKNEFRLDKPSSYGLLVAPSDVANGPEMLGGFRDFYRNLLDYKNGWIALEKLFHFRLNEGIFLTKAAHECFFATLKTMYSRMFEPVQFEKILADNDKAVMKRYGYLGKHIRPLERKRHLNAFAFLQKTYLNEMFDTFFMVEDFPENEENFGYINQELTTMIDAGIVVK